MIRFDKIVLLILLYLGFASSIKAQDIYFSQFYASPLNLNPALTGLSVGDLRLALNYRNQNQNLIPFTTYAGSFDMRILRGVLKNDIASTGVVFVKDNLAGGTVQSIMALASGAYHKCFGSRKNNYLALGFQGGYFQRAINKDLFTFSNQWNIENGYQSTIDPEVTYTNDQSSTLDMNAGIFWYNFISERSSVFAGFSSFHILEPKETFLGNDEKISRRYVFHGGRRLPIGDNISLIPNVIYMMQNKAAQVAVGSSFEYHISETYTSLKLGAWYRYYDNSIISSIGFDFKDFQIGISYDLFSKVQSISRTQGGLEFSLIYSPALKNVVDLNPDPGTSF